MDNRSNSFEITEVLSLDFIFHQAKTLPLGRNASFNFMVGPEVASAICLDYNYSGNRRLKPSVVSEYEVSMRDGDFVTEHTAICFGLLDGKPSLINGQHTLSAVAKAGKQMPLIVDFRVARSDADLKAMYEAFDRGAKRSGAESLRGLEGELGLNSNQMNLSVAAAKSIFRGLRPTASLANHDELRTRSKSVNNCEKFLTDHTDALTLFFQAIKGAPSENQAQFTRADSMACSLIILIYQPEKAFDFIRSAAHDSGIGIKNPTKRLLYWLKKNGPKDSGHIFAQAFASCWNAYFQNKPNLKQIAVDPESQHCHNFEGTEINFWEADARRSDFARATLCQNLFIEKVLPPISRPMPPVMAPAPSRYELLRE